MDIDDMGDALNRDQKDAGITIVILTMAIYFVVQSVQILDVKASTADPGAGAWPLIALAIVFICAILNLVSIYLRRYPESQTGSGMEDLVATDEQDVETGGSVAQTGGRRTYFLVLGLFFVYIALIDTIGFLILTPFFLVPVAWLLGYRNKLKLLLFGVGTSFAVQVIFGNYFNIALPRGIGIFREIVIIVENLF